jgi:hypothetical protein
VSFTGIDLAVDGRSLVEGLDADFDLVASKRGETISADVRRIEVREKKTLLARLTGAGEVTPGEKLNLSGKGRLKVDLGAVMRQPAFGAAPLLSRGSLVMAFDVASGDPVQARGNVTLRNLVARRGGQQLGDLDCQVDATLKADASACTLKMPLTLTVGGRRSDLNVDGALSRTASKLSFTGRLESKQIIVDDLRAFAALAPQGSAPAAQPAEKPADGNQAVSDHAADLGAVVPASIVAKPAPAAPVATTATQRPDSEAFWKGIAGHLDADLKRVKIGGDYTAGDIRCAAGIDETRLALENLEGKFQGNAFKIAANVTFAAKDPQPYALAGTVKIPAVNVGAFLRAANPDRAPALETTMAIDAKVSGRGATASDLANNICGQCDVTGSKGTLRALGNRGQVAGGASKLLGLVGALSNSGATMAVGELAGILKEMPFDRFSMHADRGADLNLKLTSLEFVSPMIHLTGSGAIQYKKGVSIADQPLHVEMQLAGKDQMELVLGRLSLLGEQKDGDGYTLMSSPFVIGGTSASPDSSQLWRIVGSAGLKAAAGLLIR